MNFEQSILSKAHDFIKNHEYEKALVCYELFASEYHEIAHSVRANRSYCEKKINCGLRASTEVDASHGCAIGTSKLAQIFSQFFGVEQIYIVNIERQKDRRVRILREMNKHGLKVTLISGVDGENDNIAQENLQLFKIKNMAFAASGQHISPQKRKYWKSTLTQGVFGYLLSQQIIFEDALQNGYKRILVFDDDIFFHSCANDMLQKIFCYLHDDFKVLLLGASEYANMNSPACAAYRRPNICHMYHPIPGYTCGSFAAIYDISIYHELLCYIRENAGPFDNAALGAVYLRYKDQCYVTNPAICIPDVGSSTLRQERDQCRHSSQMRWETARYLEFTKPFNVIVLINSFCEMQNANVLKSNNKSNVIMNIVYKTFAELSPSDLGETFNSCIKEGKVITLDSLIPQLSDLVVTLCLLDSDIVMVWPEVKPLTYADILTVFSAAMLGYNQKSIKKGTVDGVPYLLGYGVASTSNCEVLNTTYSE